MKVISNGFTSMMPFKLVVIHPVHEFKMPQPQVEIPTGVDSLNLPSPPKIILSQCFHMLSPHENIKPQVS